MNKVRIEIFKAGHAVFEQNIEEGATLQDLLYKLAATHKGIVELAFDFKSQKLTGVMDIILNGTFIQLLNDLETKLSDGDVIVFVLAVAGG